MAAPQASSRLEMLQARFQQKQLQEKEQKLLQLYDQQQQRAYQVVQRGSAGSNSSNHGGSTATRTTATTTTHTTSTSQGGKVRQMFDERRQTTVKGIDRSYPLEPLENKSRKQTNSLVTQRNGNSMVNRQSVNVKRITRADVNSNVNGGKPVVSYHEEIMRESFGPSIIGRRYDDEDEFVENRVATFANGYRHEADNEQEEVIDRETVENNRMMAKIHLMGFDESLKHHVRNDLENEEFPNDLMVDVPDRLPRRNVTKKLSQAEARLERFKNANAKRSKMSKQLTSTSNVIKKRSEQTTKSNSRRSEIAGTSPTDTKSGSWISDRSQRILENVKNFLPPEARAIDKISKRRRENSDIEIFNRRNNSPSFSKKPIKTGDTSIYPRKALNSFKSLTADGKIFTRHSTKPQFFCKESERSATTMSIDRKSDSSGSPLFYQTTKPQFFCKESERSATTMSIDRKSDSSGSPLFYRETLTKQSKSPPFFLNESEQSRTSESKSPIWDIGISLKQNTSPQYLLRESKRSETAMSSDREIEAVKIDRGILKKRNTVNFDKNLQTSLDRKTSFKSPSYEREILKKRNTSPQFFCKESERSGTTMSIDRKSYSSESPLFYQETLTKPSKSPHFFLSESEQSDTTSESKSPLWEREISLRRSTSPLRYEFKQSETAMSTDREITGSKSSEWNKELLTKLGTTDKKFRISDTSFNRKISKSPLYEGEILKKRSISPRSERSGTTMSIVDKSRSPSYDREVTIKRSASPRFFCKESERSGTTMSIDSTVERSRSPSYDREVIMKRSASPRFFCKESERSGTTMSIDSTVDKSRSPSYDQEVTMKRSASPRFFCKESERSGTTMSIDSTVDKSRSSSYDREVTIKRSASPRFFCKESERSGTTMSIDHKIKKPISPSYNQKILKQSTTPQLSSRKSHQRSAAIVSIDRQYDESRSSGKIRENREKRTASPQFFCKESEKSATTMLIEPRSSSTDFTKNILKQRSHTPDIFYKRSIKPLSSINKINSSQDRIRNPSIIKHETKKALKKNGISSIVTESRRSSKISETSATSTNSIVSLKYGLEFDNILQSAELVSKFMKSQNGKQHKIHQSSPKQIKNGNTLIAKHNQSRNRCKTSSFQKAISSSTENRKRATPKSPRKSITPTEVDTEIQEIIMTDHRIERDKLQKTVSPISRRQIDGTYTKSISDKTKFKTSVTYPVRKTQKQRASILKSNVFKSKEDSFRKSKKSKNNRDSEESTISLSKLDCSPINKTSQHIITRSKEDENRVSKVKTSQTQEQTWNKSVRNQAERIAFRSKKSENRQYTIPRSLKQIRNRSMETRTSKASPDSSRERKYFDDIVPHLCKPEEQSRETRAELDQLRSLQSTRLVQDTLKEKNLSASEYNRKRIENEMENVDEVDAGIENKKYQTIIGIALNEEIKDYCNIPRPNSTDQSIDKDIILREKRASTISNTLKATKKECSSQHVKSKISPRIPSLRKTVKISLGADTSKILPSQRVASNKNFTSKFLTNTIKDHKNGNVFIAKKSANLFNKTNIKRIEKSEDTAREFSKIIMQRENESEKNFERMDSVESALRRFDSIGAEFEPLGPTSFQASPEISLQTMDMQTKSSVKQTIISEGSTLIPSPEVTDNVVLKSTPKSPVNKDLKNYLNKSNLKISGKGICSIKRLEKRIENTIHSKKSTQTRSPICKRRLFESDSEKESQELNYAKARKKENYSSVSFRFHKDKTISKVKSSKNREDAKESKRLQEMPMLSVKPLRSIEDIRKSIDNEQNKIVIAKESRSAIANRRSVSRQDVDARRSVSATNAAKNVFLGDNPARLTKAKSCVSRITKSPSPDSATRKHHETNARATRGSVPSSPSKSPDIASKYASIEPKNQEAKPLRKSAVTKGMDSTGSKAATIEVVDTIDSVALQNGSLHESTTKKSDAFIIDVDDQSEGDIVLKKSPIKKSSSNKQQRASSASDRPTSVSSNSSASLTHGQVSSTKNKMTTRAKAPASGGPQAKGSFSPRSSGTSADNLVACKTCKRTFAKDRIDYHEKVCVKVVNMKRKKFDAMTFRIKGTELEPFAKKGLTKKQEAKKPQVKSDWRRKHEDFIKTIRSAKQLQAHMAAGGNLKDFPPPPSSDTSDYIQCPHCNRKFNQAAAERHIPKCETMLHNKPAHLRASRPRR